MKQNLTRAKRIIDARTAGSASAASVEQAIALELLGADAISHDQDVRLLTFPQHGYLSPMAATEAFAQELQRGLTALASNLEIKSPKRGKYHPMVATPTLFREVWRMRQSVDGLGIPYWFYVEYATLRWHELGTKRMPRPSQLTSPDIAMYVMECWADPGFRWNYPLFNGWDERFNVENYVGEPMQDRAVDLIEQRVADAKALGHDPAAVLAMYLDYHITEEEAERRFGDELVYRALELTALAIGEDLDRGVMGPGTELAEVINAL